MAVEGTGDDAVVTMDIPENVRKMLATRVDQSLPVGNEGAGEVVAASAVLRALLARWSVLPVGRCTHSTALAHFELLGDARWYDC